MARRPPEVQTPPVEPEIERALDFAAASARHSILLRAFPTGGGIARSVAGRPAPALSDSYRRYKLAKGRRPVPDQRFSSRTASALGVIRSAPGERSVGFRERQVVGASLHARNDYFGLSEREQQQALDRLRVLGDSFARRVRIKRPVIVVEVLT